ncbi:hypothetical protein F5877DRAFT_82273 [Lentinula edodes]|nr:hypothetical protein F5877DRAFT_82273 [Lentinula edodes]
MVRGTTGRKAPKRHNSPALLPCSDVTPSVDNVANGNFLLIVICTSLIWLFEDVPKNAVQAVTVNTVHVDSSITENTNQIAINIQDVLQFIVVESKGICCLCRANIETATETYFDMSVPFNFVIYHMREVHGVDFGKQ